MQFAALNAVFFIIGADIFFNHCAARLAANFGTHASLSRHWQPASVAVAFAYAVRSWSGFNAPNNRLFGLGGVGGTNCAGITSCDKTVSSVLGYSANDGIT